MMLMKKFVKSFNLAVFKQPNSNFLKVLGLVLIFKCCHAVCITNYTS